MRNLFFLAYIFKDLCFCNCYGRTEIEFTDPEQSNLQVYIFKIKMHIFQNRSLKRNKVLEYTKLLKQMYQPVQH